MVIESAKGKSVNVEITTFYQEGGAPEFDAGIKEWMNANADALTNNGGNDMVSAVTAMGYDAYFVALEGNQGGWLHRSCGSACSASRRELHRRFGSDRV